ncbi:MFS general substrate transporter [Peniophora sp. CONT]|nr:MFS general substrate transporter [Peniophora sp. CONT]
MNVDAEKHLDTDSSTIHSTSKHEATMLPELPSGTSTPLVQPDGGLLAWTQVFGAFLLTLNSGGVLNAFGAYQTFYETNLLASQSPSAISWIGSVQGLLLLVCGVLAGPIYDLGYFTVLLHAGSLAVVLGTMLTSVSDRYWQVFLAQGVLVGIGAGCFYTPSLALASSYFQKKRSFAVGIAACGSSIGGVVFPAIFRQLQPRIGFGWATRVTGFIILAVYILAAALMRPKPQKQSKRQLLDMSAFKSLPYSLFTIAIFLGYVGLYIPYFYISAYAQSKTGASPTLAYYLVSIMNASSLIGRTAIAWLADRAGPLNTLVVSSLICMVLAFSWIAIETLPSLIAFAILYGIFQGTLVSLPSATIPALSPDLKRIGAHMGMSLSFAGVGLLVGSPIAGALLDLESADFVRAQVFCGVVVAV